ncbi:MAG: hypothetical protein JNM27_10415 [Leptospirales bacterium]|nr:hypothetical protein [Leptospirales bacterium]
MTFFLEKDFRIGFFTGALLHIWFVFQRISWLKCTPDCGGITVADIPISILYFAFPDWLLIISSLLLGSVLWGFWFFIILKVVRLVVSRFVPR